MFTAARRRVAALRNRPAARLPAALIVWAVVVWTWFLCVIVVAGRSYIAAASRAAADDRAARPPVMDDWMEPAVTRGLWMATAAAGAILVTGLASVRAGAPRN